MANTVDLVIFGATGDLSRRKILPALGHLVSRSKQPVRVVGAGRSHKSTDEFRDLIKEASDNQHLAATAEWVELDYANPATFAPVKDLVAASTIVIFYLATPPETVIDILTALAEGGLSTKEDATRRVVIEKPLGRALASVKPPTTFDAEYVRRAKRAALRATSPIDPAMAVRGQYDGYLEEEGVVSTSRRETYAAARLTIENWRWDGVPIFIRTGKALKQRVTELVIKLRDAPLLRIGGRRQRGIPTLIVIRVQPDEGITLRIGAKRPGTGCEMVPAGMKLDYAHLTKTALPDAYENVLAEVLAGGHSAFPGGEEIELSWEIVDPLIEAWEAQGHPEPYAKGSWGPQAADDLVSAAGGGRWIVSGDESGTG